MEYLDIYMKNLKDLLKCPVCNRHVIPAKWRCDNHGYYKTMEVKYRCSAGCITEITINSEPLAKIFYDEVRKYREIPDCLCGQGQTCEACA